MNKITVKKQVISILIEILCLVIIGILTIFIYGYKIDINRMTIFFFSFGTSAIILFSLLKYNGFKIFLIALIILIIVLTPLLFKNPTVYSLIHHGVWILGLGIIIYLLKTVFPVKTTLDARLWGFILWVIAFAAFFFIVFMTNGLIMKYRHHIDAVNFNRILIRALKFGPALGAGIGIGYIISSKILKE